MKKIICLLLCLVMTASVFAGCMSKQMTFEEAAAAGKEFIKSEGVKDVRIINEADGKKLTVEGKYDYINKYAVLSVSIETKDTIKTYKDMIKLDGTKAYVKVPEMTGLADIPGGAETSLDLGEDLSGLGSFGIAGGLGGMSAYLGMADSLAGKYIEFKLRESGPSVLKDVMSDAEDQVYEKAEKLEPEEDYPNVVRYTQKDAYDLIIYVLDGIKAKKSELSSECAAKISEYLGEENYKAAEEIYGKSAEEIISEGIDEFFNSISPEDLAPDEAEQFELIQKIAYDKDKSLEYVFIYDIKNGEETHSVKTTLSVSAAEADEAFAEKCAVSEDEKFDLPGYLKKLIDELKAFMTLQDLFK